MARGIPIFSVKGIRVRAHWSVLVVAALVAWSFADGIVPLLAGGTPLWTRWIAGVAAAILIVLSLVLHELAHSLVARSRGVEVHDISLWLFGGASHLHDDWPDPGTELRVAIAGPLTTLGVTLVLAGMTALLIALSAPTVVVVTAEWMTAANAMLFLFNLVPAFPLDGGRIVRAVLWRSRHDRVAATRTAAGVARIVAAILMALGFADVLLTADVTGFWLVLMGWFLQTNAKREQQGEVIRGLLQGVRVRDAMTRDPVTVPSWITVELLLQQHVARAQMTTFIARDLDGSIRGLVTLQSIRRVPPKRRSSLRAADIAVPLASVPVVHPDELVTDVLRRMTPATEGRALVFSEGDLVGMVTPGDIARVLSTLRPGVPFRHPQPPPLPPAAEVPAPPS